MSMVEQEVNMPNENVIIPFREFRQLSPEQQRYLMEKWFVRYSVAEICAALAIGTLTYYELIKSLGIRKKNRVYPNGRPSTRKRKYRDGSGQVIQTNQTNQTSLVDQKDSQQTHHKQSFSIQIEGVYTSDGVADQLKRLADYVTGSDKEYELMLSFTERIPQTV